MNERFELEAEDDGYRNDYQRAHAVSSMRRDNSQRARAMALVKDGYTVAVALFPEYCPITDGLLGEGLRIISSGSSPEIVRSAVNSLRPEQIDPEVRIEIWPSQPVLAPAPELSGPDHGIPF